MADVRYALFTDISRKIKIQVMHPAVLTRELLHPCILMGVRTLCYKTCLDQKERRHHYIIICI